MCRNISSPKVRFLREANSNLVWLERRLALLRPDDFNYQSDRRAILLATRELQEIIEVANSTTISSSSAEAFDLVASEG